MNGAHWYLIKTKPQGEEVAKCNLERQNYTVYLPYSTGHKRINGKYQTVAKPTFPGYIFIYLDMVNDNWRSIRSTRGVSAIVRFGNAMPLALPSDLVPWLKQNEQLSNAEATSCLPEFKEGDKLDVIDGPFKGYNVIFSCTKAKDRVRVLLEIANSFNEIELSIHQLEYA